MKKLHALCALCLVTVLLPLFSAQGASPLSRYTDKYFSTVSALFLYTDDRQAFEQTWAEVKGILEEIQNAVSLSVPDSDLSRFNALACGESCSVSPITAEILRTAFSVYNETGGLYDPTVFPLVDLWGFSPRFNSNIYQPTQPYDRAYENGKLPPPDERYVQALQQLVDFGGVTLSGSNDQGWTLTKNIPPVTVDGHTFQAQMDLGSIAKGYACDRVLQLLQSEGYEYGHFVCGGSSIAALSRPEGEYRLTIGKPRSGAEENASFAVLTARNTTLSTSSDASHTYTRDGVIYCHIIDPRTGYPINMPADGQAQCGIACVTLLGPSAARSDALTTALCVMGPQQALAYVNSRLQGDPVVMVLYRTGEPFLEVLASAEAACTLEDAGYRLASRIGPDGNIVYTGTLFHDLSVEGAGQKP